MNIVVWFIGSNASGKTTQAALLHKSLSDAQFHAKFCRGATNDIEWCFTQLTPFSANLGKFSHPIVQDLFAEPIKLNECCGTDNLSGKESVIESFKQACENSQIVVVEGIMATGQWIHFLKNPDNIVLLIHMKVDLDYNLEQLSRRKQAKNGDFNGEFGEKTKSNIAGKISGFSSLFQRMQDEVDLAIEIDAKKPREVIHSEIMYYLTELIEIVNE